MRKSGISIAAILIACVFVLTIAAFAASVYHDYTFGAESAATRFEKLSSKTAETSGIYPCGSKEFIDAFNSAVGAPNFYELLRLEVDGVEVYLYPSIPAKSNSFFVKTFSTRIAGGDGARIELSANIYALSPTMIFNRAKIAFIVILAGTLTACILLMYLYLSESESKPKKNDDGAQESILDDDDFGEENSLEGDIDLPEYEGEQISDDENPQSDEDTIEEENLPSEFEESDAPEHKTDALPENPVLANSDFESEQPSAQDDAANESAAPQEEELPPASPGQTLGPKELSENTEIDEQGLFSPASGFGWESYLSQRLESELVRAASSEQDLALVIVRIPGITSEYGCYPKICAALLETFQYKDFIFEYKDDGFAAIVQDKDVDGAMQSAEKLYSSLVAILKEEKQKAKPVIGISSRSLRLISVDRLKTEAEQALFHASEDANSPIVAFRVNPEKYRKYISGQN